MRTTKRLFVCALMVLSVGVAACGGDDGGGGATDPQGVYDEFVSQKMPGVTLEMLQAAQKEGKVTFYTSTNLASNAVAQAFEKRFPFIKVEQVQIAGGALTERFAAEQRAGTHAADVLNTSSEPTVLKFARQGMCEKYTPTSDAAYPADTKVPGLVYRWNGTVQGIAYVDGKLNEEDVKALENWSTLGDARWKDKVFGWIDVAAGGTSEFVNIYFYREYGDKLWTDHKAGTKSVKVFGGTNPTTQALIRGEVDVTGPVGISAPYEMLTSGAPIAWSAPKPTLAVPAAGCIGAKPPHPNAAKLMWDFILSDAGQDAMAPFGSLSYKQGFQPTDPEQLRDKSWYKPADPGSVVKIPEAELARDRETVITDWRKVFGTESSGS